MAQSVNNKEENTIIVYDLSGTEALRYMSEKEKQNVIENNNNNEEIVIDVTDCNTADEVMSRLKNDKHNFQPDTSVDYNKLFVKNKYRVWLKVDDKLYIKFDSYIICKNSTLSSNQFTDKDDKKKNSYRQVCYRLCNA